jgi:hypothetical protein
VNAGATLTASLLAVLARPSTWAVALLGFLVRGGWLVVVAPIVVVPTPVGLANVIAPLLEDAAFGRRTGELVLVSVAALGLIVAVLLGGGLVAAVVETDGIRQIADEERIGWRPGRVGLRILAVRLVAHVPFVFAAAYAAARLIAVSYRELTVPSEVSAPLAWRILAGAPEAVALVLGTWLIGEMLGALAARRIVLEGERARPALRFAIRRLRRRPVRTLGFGLATTLVLAVVLAVTGLAAGATWGALGAALSIGDASFATTLLLVGFVALFVGGLVLIALTSAWRAAVWTLDVGGTFGGVDGTRTGD